jgi:3-isopropylmalate dehydratase small subunit
METTTATTIRSRKRVYARAHINTGKVITARHLNMSETSERANHALEDIDPGLASNVRPNGFLTYDDGLGCGSWGEHAEWARRGVGVGFLPSVAATGAAAGQ